MSLLEIAVRLQIYWFILFFGVVIGRGKEYAQRPFDARPEAGVEWFIGVKYDGEGWTPIYDADKFDLDYFVAEKQLTRGDAKAEHWTRVQVNLLPRCAP